MLGAKLPNLPMELIYGADLHLADEFFTAFSSKLPEMSRFLKHLRQIFNPNNLTTTGYA